WQDRTATPHRYDQRRLKEHRTCRAPDLTMRDGFGFMRQADLSIAPSHGNARSCREAGLLPEGRSPRLLIRAALMGRFMVVAGRRAVRPAAWRKRPGRAGGVP